MDYRIYRPCRHDLVEGLAVEQVDLVEEGGASGQFGNPPHRLGLAVDEVVDNCDILAASQEFNHSMAADIAGAAGNQNVHKSVPSMAAGSLCGLCVVL